MNRFEFLFSDPQRAAETLLSMNCIDPDTFESCEGCAFWEHGDGWNDLCPQYRQGIGEHVGHKDLREWLEEECDG